MLKLKKNKKIMIPVLALLLIVAMTGVAFATSYSTYLSLGETGWDSTSSLSTYNAKATGYNSHYSSETMYLKMQYYYGGWRRLNTWALPVNYWSFNTGYLNMGQTLSWRTKIYSPTGNVEGGGYIRN